MGAIVAVIGLELAGVAAGMAGLLPAEGQTPDSKTIIISITTLAVTVLGSVLFRGFLAIIPILIGVLVGYALSFAMELSIPRRLLMLTGLRCQPSIRRASSGLPF
ncbi:uracil transporter [Escherichia coli]|uniref:Uracil transporter n=1 Tax=Escherichia coli TaxID=562 RepID=A0A377AHB5_ECOLX|nr:uracil transporter [Escherichia coli]